MSCIRFTREIVCCCLFFLCCLNWVFAEPVYRWTDPWGQVQYSKTQVPGSMVTDLTELPEPQEINEQQRQDVMLKKIQEMNNNEKLLRQKASDEKFLTRKSKQNENYCRKLRSFMADVRLRKTRIYFPGRRGYQGGYYYSDRFDYYHYDNLEKDLFWEIRENCR